MASSSHPPATLLCTTTRQRRVYRRLRATYGSAAASWLRFATGRQYGRASSTPKQVNPSCHGRTVTGFTIEGELIFRILDKLRADGVVPILEAVTAAGAFYSGSVGAFDDYSITSGRLVTGTNPAS